MSKLLYIQASPRKGRSRSIAAADAFVQTYLAKHPSTKTTTMNLFETDLPQFDGSLINVKYNIMHGRDSSPEDIKAWKAVEDLIKEFKDAEVKVFAAPMWNFSIPYRLKQYIDLICQPSYTFSAGPEGYAGLTTGKVFIAYARGGEYPAGTPMEAYNFQSPYFEHILGFMGLTDVKTVSVEPTLGDPELGERAKTAAIARAVEIAKEF